MPPTMAELMSMTMLPPRSRARRAPEETNGATASEPSWPICGARNEGALIVFIVIQSSSRYKSLGRWVREGTVFKTADVSITFPLKQCQPDHWKNGSSAAARKIVESMLLQSERQTKWVGNRGLSRT